MTLLSYIVEGLLFSSLLLILSTFANTSFSFASLSPSVTSESSTFVCISSYCSSYKNLSAMLFVVVFVVLSLLELPPITFFCCNYFCMSSSTVRATFTVSFISSTLVAELEFVALSNLLFAALTFFSSSLLSKALSVLMLLFELVFEFISSCCYVFVICYTELESMVSVSAFMCSVYCRRHSIIWRAWSCKPAFRNAVDRLNAVDASGTQFRSRSLCRYYTDLSNRPARA